MPILVTAAREVCRLLKSVLSAMTVLHELCHRYSLEVLEIDAKK